MFDLIVIEVSCLAINALLKELFHGCNAIWVLFMLNASFHHHLLRLLFQITTFFKRGVRGIRNWYWMPCHRSHYLNNTRCLWKGDQWFFIFIKVNQHGCDVKSDEFIPQVFQFLYKVWLNLEHSISSYNLIFVSYRCGFILKTSHLKLLY